MDKSSDITAALPLSASQRDVAEYALTGLNIVISGVGEGAEAAHLAESLRQDIKQLPENPAIRAGLNEKGWERLQALSRSIGDTPGIQQEQAFNLLAVMAGVTSAVSTAGLVKTPEREIERVAVTETSAAQQSGRWARYLGDRTASQRDASQQLTRQ